MDITFKNCKLLYCTPVTYINIMFHINYNSILKVAVGECCRPVRQRGKLFPPGALVNVGLASDGQNCQFFNEAWFVLNKTSWVKHLKMPLKY